MHMNFHEYSVKVVQKQFIKNDLLKPPTPVQVSHHYIKYND